jgi:sialate O-acetylesterase
MFGDHMVLQREIPIPIWGTATPGENVAVGFRDQTKRAVADANGRWLVRLDPLAIGEPGRLTVSGSNSLALDDVLVGEVWLGAGQSNIAGGAGLYAVRDEALAELLKAAPHPKLRLYQSGWEAATERNSFGFSALLFAFGQPLQKELGVPVGLIAASVGDSPTARWLSREMLGADPACRAALGEGGVAEFEREEQRKYEQALAFRAKLAEQNAEEGRRPPGEPAKPIRVGDLYATRVEPMIPYAIRGVLWDQGEAGTAVPGIPPFTMMGALIAGWRKAWGQGDFPFLYVQKPSGGGCTWDAGPFGRRRNRFATQPSAPNKAAAGRRREHWIRIMETPRTAMVTASDLAGGLHPIDKSGYGRRACRVALGFIYGRNPAIYGPIYDSHTVEGGEIRVRFKHVGKGLVFRHGEKLQGFEIAGSDGVYHWAEARIEGDAVVVASPAVARPVHVRYGWAEKHAWANLFNRDRLPALTFRTERGRPRTRESLR